MGFSSGLQGSMESLLARQDSEIRLMENMKRCLTLRIKADRDYAIHLNAFVLQAQPSSKMDKNSIGSLTLSAWSSIINETEKLVKHIKDNADYLATSTMDKINLLLSEKKVNRKYNAEEHSRITMELHRLQDSVHKTKCEYEKCLENYTSVKNKYEIGGGNDNKNERYQKVLKKLHLTHNEYILLLCEAVEFERDMRTVLLPGLLEQQQSLQENMVEKLKIILGDIHRCTNNANRKCNEMQLRVEKSIGAVKPSEEYLKFIEVHKSSPPEAVVFKFDVRCDVIGLNKNGVSLNDCTIDSLKTKLNDIDRQLAEIKNGLKDKQTLTIQFDAELSTLNFKSDPVSVNKAFNVKRSMDLLKKEIQELKCIEQKLNKQNDVIRAPLNELGCEVVPSIFDTSVSVNGSFEISSSSSDKTQKALSLLKKPFGQLKKTGSHLSVFPSQNNNIESLSSSQTNITSSDDANISVDNNNIAPPPPALPHTGPEFPVSRDNPPISPIQCNRRKLSPGSIKKTMTYEVGKPLEEELWFHGVLPRGEVVRLLENDGDFLIRETVRNDEKQIVLSVMWASPKHFIVQTSPEGLFRFEGPAFGTVQELIVHQFHSETSVTSRSGAILKTPVLREKWELNNDDVELLDKIGRGNFGDVYKAHLKSENIDVAVKTCKVTLPDEQKKKFLQEGRILKQYDHPNIVKFIGICVQKQPIMIVMELVPGGSLLNYLRNNGNALGVKNLLGMCLDASAGMQYLESKNCIHRDLAARNCLVGESNVVKISDFGMSREEEEYTVSDGLKQIPIKWTAPEALNYGKYTSLCDVWSFGVLCWEIFSKGGTPYQGMTNTRSREMLDSGYRMPSPENTPEDMYQLMLRCWHYEPEERPHFPEIHAAVDLLYSRFSVGPETRV